MAAEETRQGPLISAPTNRHDAPRSRRGWSIAFALGFCILLAWAIRGTLERQRLQRFRDSHLWRLIGVASTVSRIYSQSGQQVRTLDQLERSAFFPFSERYSSKWPSGGIYVLEAGGSTYASDIGGKSILMVRCRARFTLAGRPMVGVNDDYEALPAAERTSRFLKFAASGPAFVLKEVEAERQIIAKHSRVGTSDPEVRSFHPVALPAPPAVADARTAGRGTQYLAWLRGIFACDVLSDGWGRQVRAYEQHGSTYLASDGPDGRPNTFDDMRVPLTLDPGRGVTTIGR